MYRIGILGAENSHATVFARIFNGYIPELADRFPDMRVTAVGGNVPEANRKVYEECGLELLCEHPEEMLGKVDAVMVTARDGAFHAPFAWPFIEAGIPAFIDKPFTRNPEEALALVKLAKERRVPLAGGSSVKLCAGVGAMKAAVLSAGETIRGGDVSAPVSLVNEYGGFWFYAAHLAESCLTIFGPEAEWIWASRTEQGVTAVVHYPRFEVTNHFTESAYYYSASLMTTEGTRFEPLLIDDIYALECESFAKMLRTGEMDFSYEELVRPVFYLAAVEQAYSTGRRQAVPAMAV